MKRAEIEQRSEALVLPILKECGFELWDVEYVKEGANYYLRVYIDKPGGITIDDCVTVSRAFEQSLDEEDFIADAYILEVSSPGLGRQLKRERDFERSIGSLVEIRLYQPLDGQKEWTGVLQAYDAETVTLELEDKELKLKRSDLALIRLAFDF